jgi:shikimate kinase
MDRKGCPRKINEENRDKYIGDQAIMNIALYGFMASGKTTVGKILAKRLGYYFIDMDEEIERVEGRSIKNVFETNGEPYFRELEKKVTIKLSQLCRHVIACGGGTMLNQENVEALRESSILILLSTNPKEILRRIENDSTRPLLNVQNRMNRIEAILGERILTYIRLADIEVDTTDLSPDEVSSRIFEQLMERER